MRALLFAMTLLVGAGIAQADEAAAVAPLSFEAKHVVKALKGLGRVPDRTPEGKIIGEIEYVRYEVFLEDEPFVTFPNALHWLTREAVIQREMLVAPGDDYTPARLLETARNLRSLGIFQLVAVVPVVSPNQGSVDIVVITRDLWSLRLEWNLQFNGDQIDQLLVQITERNLFGSNVRATLRSVLMPITLTLGEVFVDRRFLGEALTLEQTADIFINRETDDFEGYDAFLAVSRPFFNLAQRWGFRVPVRVQKRVARQVRAGDVATYDDPATPEDDAIPRVWDSTYVSTSAVGRLQISGDFNQRISAGLGFSHRGVEINDLDAAVPAASLEAFRRDVLPRALTQVYPVIGWAGFETRYRTFENLSSYGVSEDVRLGPVASATLTAPLEALGSTVDAIELYGSVGWTLDFAGDGLVELGVGAEARYEGGAWINQQLLTKARFASPSLGIGRLIARFDWLAQHDDTTNNVVFLGGSNGLRGYPSGVFQATGGDRIRGNVEARTAPVVWSYFHGGLVMFYDVGDVYAGRERDPFVVKHTVGLGLRGLLPQFNREVFRIDLGVPVDGTGFMLRLSGGTGQSVPLTAREDAQFETSVGGLALQP